MVDTSNWIDGKSVRVSPSLVTSVDSAHGTMAVSLTRDEIKRSPPVDSANINPAETLPTIWIM